MSEPRPTSWEIRRALVDAWEQGNCTGLDGWVGEDRGTQEPDSHAIYNRERDVNAIVKRLFPDPPPDHSGGQRQREEHDHAVTPSGVTTGCNPRPPLEQDRSNTERTEDP